jgi:hypothetical protein
VEDLALSVQEFEDLCVNGTLKPHARHLGIKPHLRLWPAPAGARASASGHVELEGFLPNSVLRLAGYSFQASETDTSEDDKKRFAELLDTSLLRFLREKFPTCELNVSPATFLRGA